MTDERAAPIFFFAPFVSSTMRVEPSWIDYNGHMNMAYYHVLFDRAVEEGFGVVGLGAGLHGGPQRLLLRSRGAYRSTSAN